MSVAAVVGVVVGVLVGAALALVGDEELRAELPRRSDTAPSTSIRVP